MAQGTRYSAQRRTESAAAEHYVYVVASGHRSEPFEGNTYCAHTVRILVSFGRVAIATLLGVVAMFSLNMPQLNIPRQF